MKKKHRRKKELSTKDVIDLIIKAVVAAAFDYSNQILS